MGPDIAKRIKTMFNLGTFSVIHASGARNIGTTGKGNECYFSEHISIIEQFPAHCPLFDGKGTEDVQYSS